MDEQSQPSPSPPNDQAKGRPQEPNVRFFMIVGVLLLIIIALLAGLWLRERVRATASELDLGRLRARNEYLEAMIKQLDAEQIALATAFKVFYLKKATAVTLQATLQQLFNQRVARGDAKDP